MDVDARQQAGGLAFGQACRAGFDELTGFGRDDLAEAYRCFHASARAIVDQQAELRPALRCGGGLGAVSRIALNLGPALSQKDASRFFETHFEPVRISGPDGADAFYTGYYEPVVAGSLEPSADFAAPLLARPADLKTFGPDVPRPAWAADLAAARMAVDGTLSPYPVRAAIEAAAIGGHYRPVAWLRDWVEVFLIQVQGSARVRLADGRLLRITYAGRNGHPYTSIGRLLVEAGHIDRDAMSLDVLKDWLRRHGLKPGMAGRTVMQRNASYVFFEAAATTSEVGPTGAQGVPLTPRRSIAVDRSLWFYGLPFWVDADLPWTDAAPARFRRLMVAQDTGSAIVGPARADIYFGSGAEAGRLAGGIRHRGSFTVLWPRTPGGAEA